ncbi:hypothetical protein C8R45DRAFT_936508 [Mycena sanguinolenta]|nr:hypothetical protein C8R45DRAFT_936508 [Mycena sanguinolenta]
MERYAHPAHPASVLALRGLEIPAHVQHCHMVALSSYHHCRYLFRSGHWYSVRCSARSRHQGCSLKRIRGIWYVLALSPAWNVATFSILAHGYVLARPGARGVATYLIIPTSLTRPLPCGAKQEIKGIMQKRAFLMVRCLNTRDLSTSRKGFPLTHQCGTGTGKHAKFHISASIIMIFLRGILTPSSMIHGILGLVELSRLVRLSVLATAGQGGP